MSFVVSDLAKNLLSQYYGIGETSNTRKFLSIHQCIENTKSDQEESGIEKPLPLSDDHTLLQKNESENVDNSDCDLVNKVYTKSSRALDDIDDLDNTKETCNVFNVNLGRNIICDQPSKTPLIKEEFDNTEVNSNKTVFDTLDDAETNDLSLSFIEDVVPDSASDVSSIITSKRSKKTLNYSTQVPPISKKQAATCNETYADFSDIGLTVFPVELLEKFPLLRMLYLENNNLSNLPEALFTHLQQLQWLDVRNNQLTVLPVNIKSHPSLETLLLQGNKFEILPLELCLMPRLKNISVAQNPLMVPSEHIIASGSTSVLNFLQDEWNKLHPKAPVIQKRRKIEPKLSTILCYQSPRENLRPKALFSKKLSNEKSLREKKKAYKPSNRCKNTGADILMEQRLLWISNLKEILNQQSLFLQKAKNADSLSEWRQDKRSYMKSMEKAKKRNQDNIPFATDFDTYSSVMTKSKSVTQKKKYRFTSAMNINKYINELLESMNQLKVAENSNALTPKSKQKTLQQKIQNITQLQNEIQYLRKYCETAVLK